jgi:hypothetical protein
MTKKISDLLQSPKTNWFEENVVGNAPVIMAVFANAVVIFADYRAYDVVYQLTGVWWKALAASLACAVPFILWEIGWQYNHTTENWRLASLLMAGLAFFTSIFLGVADYLQFTGKWADILLAGVVILTGVHTIMGFLYYYNDPDVARRRRKAQALAQMQDQETNADVAKSLLESGESLLGLIDALGKRFDPDDVERVLAILQGNKVQDKPKQKTKHNQQMVSYAAETELKDKDFTQGGQ